MALLQLFLNHSELEVLSIEGHLLLRRTRRLIVTIFIATAASARSIGQPHDKHFVLGLLVAKEIVRDLLVLELHLFFLRDLYCRCTFDHWCFCVVFFGFSLLCGRGLGQF